MEDDKILKIVSQYKGNQVEIRQDAKEKKRP
jgi:hypothetical protein